MAEEKDENLDSKDKEAEEEAEKDSKDTESDEEETDSDSDENEDEEEGDSEDDDVESLKAKNKRLFARAKNAEALLKKAKLKPEVKKDEDKPEKKEQKPEKVDVDSAVNEALDKRDLDALDVSSKLKKEIKNYAKLNKVSIKKAFESDYISFLKDKEDKDKKAEDAGLGGKGKGKTVKKDYDNMTANDFDMTTEEGRKDFEAWEAHVKKKLG